jgi:hypothetical protein
MMMIPRRFPWRCRAVVVNAEKKTAVVGRRGPSAFDKARSPEGQACAKGENELGIKFPLMGRTAAARIGHVSLRPRHNCGGLLPSCSFFDAPSVRGNDGHGTVREMRRVLIREQQDARLILSVFCFFSSTANQISNHL